VIAAARVVGDPLFPVGRRRVVAGQLVVTVGVVSAAEPPDPGLPAGFHVAERSMPLDRGGRRGGGGETGPFVIAQRSERFDQLVVLPPAVGYAGLGGEPDQEPGDPGAKRFPFRGRFGGWERWPMDRSVQLVQVGWAIVAEHCGEPGEPRCSRVGFMFSISTGWFGHVTKPGTGAIRRHAAGRGPALCRGNSCGTCARVGLQWSSGAGAYLVAAGLCCLPRWMERFPDSARRAVGPG